jgi:hypothetical protein
LAFVPFHVLLAALAGPTLSGNASCPRPDEVATLLATMLPEDAAAPATPKRGLGDAGGDRGEILARGLETAVRLTDANGTLLDERVLEGLCEERAHLAAVLLAIWEARLGVEAPVPVADPPTTTASVAVAKVPASEQMEIHRRTTAMRLGAALVASVDIAGLAPTGMLELQAQPWVGIAWGRLAVEATGEKSLALGQGDARWSRLTLGTGAVFERGTGRIAAALRGDFLVSRISVQGDGFASNHQGTVWQAGADLGLRLQLSLSRRASLWLDFSALAWPGQQVLSAGNVMSTRSLPSLEGHFGLGGTFPLMP